MKKIINWFKEYGYYYKMHFVAGGFALILCIILVVQIFTKTDYDIFVTYLGPVSHTVEGLESIENAIKETLDDELSKEVKEISIRDIVYLNKELFIQGKNDNMFVSSTSNSDAVKLLNSEISVGDSYIYILDKEQYDKVKTSGALSKLSDVTKNVPEGAEIYGIPLKKTEFGNSFACFANYRDDMYLCLRANTSESAVSALKGKESVEAEFELHRKVFECILNYQSED